MFLTARRLAIAAVLLLAPAQAWAANCAGFTYTLTNGQTADANQVMANFNTLLNCANNNLAHNGANSDITQLNGLTTPLTAGQGGTGTNTLTAHAAILGEGGSAVGFAPVGTAGNVMTDNGASSDPTFQPVPQFPAGVSVAYAGATAPTGWLLEFGQCLSTTTFATLYAAIADTWTSTDSCSAGTFGVPDMRGRAAFGDDAMGGTPANRLGSNSSTGGIAGTASLGVSGGQQAHTQTLGELVPHTHTYTAPNSPTPVSDTGSARSAVQGLTSTTTGSAGSGAAANVTPPAMVFNYIIKT